jgi:hypothetical protein
MAKLIIQHDSNNGVYWYCESDRHHRICEPQRKAEGLVRVDWNDLAEECKVEPGTYMVVPIVEV